MNHGLAARLLIALSLTMVVPAAMAKPDAPHQAPGDEVALPDQTKPQPEPESKPAMPVTGSRGQLLYENHCQGCHTSVVHVREKHRAHSMAELQGWVSHWANELKLPWGEGEINDVANYLNQRFYNHP